MPCPHPTGDPLSDEFHRLFLIRFPRHINGEFTVVTLRFEVSAPEDQRADYFEVAILCCGMERCVTILFTAVGISAIGDQQFNDLVVVRRCR